MCDFPGIVPQAHPCAVAQTRASQTKQRRVCGKASMVEVPDNRSRKEMSHSTFLFWLHRACKTDEEAPKPDKILPQWATCVVLSTSQYPLGVFFSKTQMTPLARGMRLHLTLSGV